MVDKVISEFEVRDLASEALRQIEERMNAARRSGEALVTTEEKNDRARRAALKSFENLERAQNRLQAAEQRRDQQLTRIARAESLKVASDERLARAERNVQEAFEQTARALRGNTTAYEQLRNRLDPITRSQREFAIGQDIIQKALDRGEVSLERNSAELERVQAALDDQARATRFTSDAYAQLQQRLDPLVAAQREFDIAQSTVNDALARGRINATQAAADLAKLRQEFENSAAAARNQGNALDDLEASLDPVVAATRRYNQDLSTVEAAQRDGSVEDERAARIKGLLADRLREVTEASADNVTAFSRLRNEIDPLARAEAELARRIQIVEAAVESGETSEVEAARVKQALTTRVEDLRASIERQGSAYQRIKDRIDPVSAAERRLADDLREVDRALRNGEIGLEEHGRAAAQLKAEFDRLQNGTDTSANAFRELQLRIDPAARALEEFRRDSDTVTAALNRQEISAEQAAAAMRILEERYRRTGAAADRADGNFNDIGRGIGRLNLAFTAGAAIIGAFGSSLAIRKLAEFNDVLQQSENRLRIVTDGVGELAVTQEALFASSQRSFTSILGGVEIYERLARSTRDLDISNQRLLTVTEAVQKSVALSGTTTLAANAALIQFGQGLAANSLRGQELNSVMEQTPRLARALAEGLGIGIGELRSLANQGELTAELVIEAIESQVDVINSEFRTIEPTLEQATQAFVNSATIIGNAFAEPIFDRYTEALVALQQDLDRAENRAAATALGQSIAADLDIAFESANALLRVLGSIATFGSNQRARAADNIIAFESGQAFDPDLLEQTQRNEGRSRAFQRFLELRREQLAVERSINEEVERFNRQVGVEKLGAVYGLTAAAARDAAVSAGLLNTTADALDAAKAEEFARTLVQIGQGEFDKPVEDLRKEWEEANRQLALFRDLGPEAIAALNAAAQQSLPQIRAFIDQLESRLGDLRKERDEDRLENDPVGVFNERFPQASEDDRQRVAELAKEIAALGENTKKTADNFLELTLRARQLSDLQIELEAARTGGSEGLEAAREEIELQRELIRLEADARSNGEAFNRAAEESRLRQIQTLEREIQIALDAYDELQRRQDRIREDVAEGVEDDIGRITDLAGRDRRFASANRAQADIAFQQAIEALNRRLEEFEDVDSLAFNDQEDIENIREAFGEGADDIRDAMFDGAEELERSIRDSVANLTGSLIEDLLFNAGRGIGDIFQDQLRESLGDIVIGPLQDFFSGDSADLFGDIEAGLTRTVERFQRVGGQLDKIFGTGGTFAAALGGAGAGFAGFGLGTGAADIFNGSQGETGSKVGGAVGGGIGFAVGGPIGAFIGSAVGGFFGDIFGGLFGRKTATGTVDFLTGETDLTDSKKDGRNETRNVILEQSIQAIEALAEALGANILPGTGLEVNVGKRSITTDIIDPNTGRVIQRAGTSEPGDVADAISDILDAALDAVLTGGDENLRAIAQAFSAADVPAEQLLESLSSLSSIFDFIEEPASEFSQILDEVVDVFEDASAVAGRYAAAQREIAQAQLDTLEALAGRFDDDVEDATRRLTDPILQDALDLSEEQLRRIEDATRLNAEIIKAVNAVNAAPATGASPGAGRPGGRLADFLGADGRRFLEEVAAAAAPGTTADTVSLADAQAAAQERLNAVLRLNVEEFRAFIQNAGNTPEAFAAVAAAIAQLSESAEDLGLDFDVLADELEALREGIAAEFDESERRRRLSVENPLALQAEELIDAQVAIIESANAIGGTQEELAERLARVFETNALEIERFIESAASTPDAIGEIIEALERLKERADEVGLTPGQIDEAGQGAIIGAGDAFLRTLNQDFLEFTNAPLARFTQLLEQQQRLVETAVRFAQFNPQRFGGLPTIVQNRNALEREQFLDDLSDEDRLELGNFLGLIEDYGGRIAVVTTQLRDTLETTVTEIEDELDRLSGVAEGAFENANSLADARQSILDRFFPGSPLEQLDDISARLEAAFSQALTGDEAAIEDVESLAGRLVEQGADVFGANDQFVAVRDRALEILRLTEEAERARGEEAERQIDILEADLEVSRNILASLESAQDNTLYLQTIVENGVLQNQLLEDTIAELIRLRALQSGVDLDRVDAVAGITDPNQILGALRTTSSLPDPTTDQINAILRSISSNSATDFTFAQSSLDFASQIADIVALARQSAPEITNAASDPVTATPTPASVSRPSAPAPTNDQNTDIVLAVTGLETTLVGALSTLVRAVESLKEEVRILRQDNQRLNNELKAAYRLAVTQSN